MSEKVCVIGLGEIGGGLLKELHARDADVWGVDVDISRVNELNARGYKAMSWMIKGCDVYIVCVYLTSQVLEVVESIDTSNNPLVIIESTIEPGTFRKLLSFGLDIVLFPHRYNSNDSEHAYFNIDRIIGGTNTGVGRAITFYEKYIPAKYLRIFPAPIVEIAKPLENAYRFMEIAFVEELAPLCKHSGIDFGLLRSAVNTKWNIEIKEARDGINGKCLPKDMAISRKLFKRSKFFKLAIQVDNEYKKRRS